MQTAEPSLHSTHTYSAQNASNTHLWLNDSFWVKYSLTYKKPLHKKLRHSVFEKTIDKTAGCCPKKVG